MNHFLTGIGGCAIMCLGIVVVGWLGYVIHSIARAADALERIADALEDDEQEEGEK